MTTILRHRALHAAAFLGMCPLFAGACRRWPLFISNQNTDFLHGLARAGYGQLAGDRVASRRRAPITHIILERKDEPLREALGLSVSCRDRRHVLAPLPDAAPADATGPAATRR